jgi:hypothetical protein
MNVEIGAEAALFPEKEYINGIAVAVHNFFCYCTLLKIFSTAFYNSVILKVEDLLRDMKLNGFDGRDYDVMAKSCNSFSEVFLLLAHHVRFFLKRLVPISL